MAMVVLERLKNYLMAFNQDIVAIQSRGDALDIRYLFYIFKAKGNEILAEGIKPGVTVQSFHSGFFKETQIYSLIGSSVRPL